jgi:hypothetical protein
MSRRRIVFCVVMALVTLIGWTVLIANVASAAPAEVDTRPCVVSPEFKRLPKDQGKQAIERWIDTRGWVAYRDLMVLVKHYKFCDHPYGWLAVGYIRAKSSPGWTYYGSVLIYRCMHAENGGTWVPCDNTKPHWLEEILLDGSDRSGS